MYENDPDDRFETALKLAEVDPARAAEALRSIVADDTFDPDTPLGGSAQAGRSRSGLSRRGLPRLCAAGTAIICRSHDEDWGGAGANSRAWDIRGTSA
jgi:hypothetical protein